MGILYSHFPTSPRPEGGHIGGPTLRTPLSVLNAAVPGAEGTECEPFEIRLMNCAEAYGLIRSKEKCKDLFEDFRECAHRFNQIERIYHLGWERRRQYWKGVFGLGPKVDRWAPNARQDAYAPDPWEDMGLGSW